MITKSVSKQIFLLIACAALAAGCLAMIRNPESSQHAIGWAGLLFFGGGGVIYLVRGLTSHATLTLDEDGFSFTAARRGDRYEWQNVSPFAVIRVGRARTAMVGFSVANKNNALQNLNQGLVGAGVALPNIYAMSPEKLAGLMNAYRAQALRRGGWAPDRRNDDSAPLVTFRRKI